MGDMGDIFREHKKWDDARKQRNLKNADPKGWTIHTEYHWSRDLNGKRLDYWPSRNKFQYEGRIMTGDVLGFIRKREQANARGPMIINVLDETIDGKPIPKPEAPKSKIPDEELYNGDAPPWE